MNLIHNFANQIKKAVTTEWLKLLLSKGYTKDNFAVNAYEFELSHKSRQSRVYHQDGVLHIINSAGIAYHHCEKKCSLRLMIYTFGDEIHASRDDIRLAAMIYHCFRNG